MARNPARGADFPEANLEKYRTPGLNIIIIAWKTAKEESLRRAGTMRAAKPRHARGNDWPSFQISAPDKKGQGLFTSALDCLKPPDVFN
jgi:hypothetical protein